MHQTPQLLDGPIVTRVTIVDRITRTAAGRFYGDSLPGHLIHVVVHGRVVQSVGGVRQEFAPKHAIWYYENEPVQGTIVEPPWTFYTVAFEAPTLSPPTLGSRVIPVTDEVIQRADTLVLLWREVSMPPIVRHLRIHAVLLDLLSRLVTHQDQHQRADAATQLWWNVERRVRQDLAAPIGLDKLTALGGKSQRSLLRACYLATGTSPMKRIKRVKLEYAQGLVQHSNYSISEIAFRVGYNRVQEFSRDYHRHYGVSPTEDRKSVPRYKERRS